MKKLVTAAFAGLVGLLIAVPSASADNCHTGRSYAVYQQQAVYQAPYAAQQSYVQGYGYTQAVPYAVPYVVIPDTFYRVDSATAYARIAEAAAEAAAQRVSGQQGQQMLALFQDFLKQQAAIQNGQRTIPPAVIPDPPQKSELPTVPPPPVPQPPSDKDHQHPNQPPPKAPASPAEQVTKFFHDACVKCHKPNTKRLDLTGDVTKLTRPQLLDVYFRITAPDDSKKVMPPVEKGKNRPTTIQDVNAVHAMASAIE